MKNLLLKVQMWLKYYGLHHLLVNIRTYTTNKREQPVPTSAKQLIDFAVKPMMYVDLRCTEAFCHVMDKYT